MPALSVVIITLNEEKNLPRCLDSVKEIADDIVILDSGSTDGTEEISKRYAARFFQQPWKGYAEQKNDGNALARYDWIFSIDADEALSEALKKSILEIKQMPGPGYYRIGRITNYCGRWIRHGGWYPDIKLRFFDRRVSRWEGHIHEKLNIPAGQGAPLLAGDCYHYSYYSIGEHKAQADRFSGLSAEDLFHQRKKAGLIKLWLAPAFRFFRMIVLRGGFLDGKYGWVIARISAHAVYLKYKKLRHLYAPPV